MNPDRHDDRHDRADRPTMDPTRSADIRALLVRTVAAAPRPRTARLSRAAFSLAATAALLFAGGIGAGTVVAYDRLSDTVVAQNSSGPEAVNESGSESGDALHGQSAESLDAATDSDLGVTEAASDELIPVLELNGETGYAYRSDMLIGQAAQANSDSATGDFATEDTAEPATGAARVPIYQSDGVTVLGYFDPAGLLP
ncbi:hypothetical protein K2F54_10340 [Cryobacterium sp. 1639]|uniref:hypothetical protein n=1 Tax=Cryobacterium inferilacus TaxID=2866629 RepID=UPI001C72B5E2|nr:hypothetical protein [Cryobacterium sp. 1639]MBX0300373.1 hypothetical protein [Cryobacterium sp. 1639]